MKKAAVAAVMAVCARAGGAPISIINRLDENNYFAIASSTTGSVSAPANYRVTNNGTTFPIQFTATGNTPAP